jgi:hypothetical protein
MVLAALPARAGEFVFTDIRLPGGYDGEAIAVNSRNEVIGFVNPPYFDTMSFVWCNGATHVLRRPSLIYLSDLNVHGIASGFSEQHQAGLLFDVRTLKVRALPPPPGGDVYPLSINARGVTVGNAFDPKTGYKGYLADGKNVTLLSIPGADHYTTADVVNEAGEVAGTYYDVPNDTRGYTYKDGRFTKFDVPGSIELVVTALDAAGRVGGFYFDAANVQHGYVYNPATGARTIDYPGALGSQVMAFGARGDLVGDYTDAVGSHGFIYAGGHFTAVNAPNATTTFLYNANAMGTVVGTYTPAKGSGHAFVAICPASQGPCRH